MTTLEADLRRGAPRAGELPELAAVAAAAGLLDVAYMVADTPVGRLVLATTPAGLVACSYDEPEAVAERLARRVSPRVLRSAAALDGVRRELDQYFAGRRRHFGVQVDLALAGVFGQEVLRATSTVGYGETTTYSAVADRIGRPRAARAVGNALGANPVCVIVPCHRVLRAGGGAGGYAGGVAAKELLLALERGARAVTDPGVDRGATAGGAAPGS